MIDWNGSPMISIEIRKWSYTQLIMNNSAEDNGFGKWKVNECCNKPGLLAKQCLSGFITCYWVGPVDKARILES